MRFLKNYECLNENNANIKQIQGSNEKLKQLKVRS